MTLVELWLITQTAPDGATSPSGLVVLAAAVGACTGISGAVVAWRNARSAASQGYVDQNLAAMQAVIDRQDEENVRLRTRNDEQRTRIRELETDLKDVRKECDECLARVKVLESKD